MEKRLRPVRPRENWGVSRGSKNLTTTRRASINIAPRMLYQYVRVQEETNLAFATHVCTTPASAGPTEETEGWCGQLIASPGSRASGMSGLEHQEDIKGACLRHMHAVWRPPGWQHQLGKEQDIKRVSTKIAAPRGNKLSRERNTMGKQNAPVLCGGVRDAHGCNPEPR